jgi:hypothetical protein
VGACLQGARLQTPEGRFLLWRWRMAPLQMILEPRKKPLPCFGRALLSTTQSSAPLKVIETLRLMFPAVHACMLYVCFSPSCSVELHDRSCYQSYDSYWMRLVDMQIVCETFNRRTQNSQVKKTPLEKAISQTHEGCATEAELCGTVPKKYILLSYSSLY